MHAMYFKIINTGEEVQFHRGDDIDRVAAGDSLVKTISLTDPRLDNTVRSWRAGATYFRMIEL